MKIAILHYHLHPGGVTRIIASQIKALLEEDNKHDMKVLCGTGFSPTSLSGVEIIENPGLQYMKADYPEIDYQQESERIRRFIKFQAEGYILHCHNPNLGKNPSLTLALYKLALEGYRIVNHCHDFAEDRPGNMVVLERMIHQVGLDAGKVMYPDMENYHFAVLNSCDYDRIMRTGIPSYRVHMMPNPVTLGSFDPLKDKRELRSEVIQKLQMDKKKKICTYPVRAIRRKNLGEFLLLAVLFENNFQFVITQAPKNPDEESGYLRWKDFCWKHNIGIKFEAGEIVNHEDLIGISDFCITTSAREGFGMVYLEPWLAGTPVSGRNLAYITADLEKYGLKFPGLYDRLLVPYAKDVYDFKDLNPEEQEKWIIRILESSSEKEKLTRMNPFLRFLLTSPEPGIIEQNRQIIINQFSTLQYGKRLLALYKSFSG
jgi:glycosyltransferase involved in cell wall biosynthesis